MENLGNIITLLTLLGTIALGISDISRRRAEAKKLLSESRSTDMNADTVIMTQIKQASIDLVNSLRQNINELETENNDLKLEASYYKGILRAHGIKFHNFDTRPLPPIK